MVTEKDAPVFLEHVGINDAAGRDIGSCFPANGQLREREIFCYDSLPIFGRVFTPTTITLEAAQVLSTSGRTFTVAVVQSAEVTTKIIQVDLHFDREVLELLDLEPSDAYRDARFVSGVAGQAEEETIREANRSGTIRNATLVHDEGSVPPGEHVAFRAHFAARKTGVSPILISGQELLDGEFLETEVAAPESSLSAAVQAGQAPATSTAPASPTGFATVAGAGQAPPEIGQAAPLTNEADGEGGGIRWKKLILIIAAVNVAAGALIATRGLILRSQEDEWG